MKVAFNEPARFDSRGRNGFIRTHGVEVTSVSDTVWFNPVTSRGESSEACRVVIPFADLDEVIAALQALKEKGQRSTD